MRSSLVFRHRTLLRPGQPPESRRKPSYAINLLDAFTGSEAAGVHAVDAAWTSKGSAVVRADNGKSS